MNSDRPNRLYIFTDQQSADAMSCAGNPYLHTPALDRLAESGVRFEKTYCRYPLSTPSRASIFSGLMLHEAEIDGNNQPLSEQARLQGPGHTLTAWRYDCVYGGKWHVPEVAMQDGDAHGFRMICSFDDNQLAQASTDYLEGCSLYPLLEGKDEVI
jgi:arylsulfatase A-like enzyme